MPGRPSPLAWNKRDEGSCSAERKSSEPSKLPLDEGIRPPIKHMLTATLIVIGTVGFLFWKWGPRRLKEPGFRYVYVNQDGSVRELSPEERDYLSEKFYNGDGGRPYIKSSYESHDGWGSQSGFIPRRQVPTRM